MSEIKEEVEGLVKAGYKEIVLVGINLSCYGKESQEKKGNLVDVIEMVAEIKGVSRVRLGSLEPEVLTKAHLKRMAALENFCPQFHISMQSGSNITLERMKRHYTNEDYMRIVTDIKEIFENPSITTDIMVGFPGESEDEFLETIRFAKKIAFARSHIFAYSRRKGTVADEMEGQISSEVKGSRSKRLIQVTDELSEDFLKSQIGTRAKVLFETRMSDGFYEGYSKNYTPILLKSAKDIAGEELDVKLVDVKDGFCLAEEI